MNAVAGRCGYANAWSWYLVSYRSDFTRNGSDNPNISVRPFVRNQPGGPSTAFYGATIGIRERKVRLNRSLSKPSRERQTFQPFFSLYRYLIVNYPVNSATRHRGMPERSVRRSVTSNPWAPRIAVTPSPCPSPISRTIRAPGAIRRRISAARAR